MESPGEPTRVVQELPFEASPRYLVDTGVSVDDHVQILGEGRSIATEDLSNDPLDPVAPHGRPDLARDRDPESASTHRVG
jgi:hypothetical protein